VLGIDIENEEMGLDEVESVGGRYLFPRMMAKLGDPHSRSRDSGIEFARLIRRGGQEDGAL
jgi:hypothetical protein